MFRGIISMPEAQYLGFGLMMPWENNLEIQFALWKDGFASGKIDRLKEICGSEKVVGIFCYKCDMETQTFSYHIACENKLNALSSEFETLKLKTLDYAHFENDCTDVEERFITYEALCNEIWGQWLPESKYISLIEPETFGCVDGYASLELYTPENPNDGSYNLKMLLPIKRKQTNPI